MSITQEGCQELLNAGVISEEESVRLSANARFQKETSNKKSEIKKDIHKKRRTAAFLGIFLGGFCAHKAYLKQISSGIIAVIITVIAFGFILGVLVPGFMLYSGSMYSSYGAMVLEGFLWIIGSTILSISAVYFAIAAVLGLIEGTIYFTLSDEEFQELYVDGTRKWF